MNPQYLGILLIVLSASGFATIAVFIKIAYSSGANTITVMAFRFILASILLWSVIAFKHIDPRIKKQDLIKLSVLGVCGYAVMSSLFASSLHYLSASLATLLLYTYPIIVTLLSVALGDEKLSVQKGLALTICLLGLILVVGISSTQPPTLGLFLILSAATVYSCYIIISNKLLKNIDPFLVTTYICSSAAITLLLTGTATNSLVLTLPASGWLAILGMAFFGTLIAVGCFFAGMHRVGPSNASIISIIEPVVTAILSAILLSEAITPWQAGGGMLILSGIIILQYKNKVSTIQETVS